jgi:predicted MFS family arabinose efflux permease
MPDTGQLDSGEPLEQRPATVLLPPSHRRSAIFFLAVNFFYWACLYLYVPILPVYAQSLGASLSMVGIVVAAYAIPQVLLRIPIGVLSDIVDKRKFLVAGGIAMTLLGALGLGMAPSPWFLFLARTVTGIGAGAWVVFTVYFASYYPAESTGRAIGIINFVQGFALVAATSGGGIIAEVWGFKHAFFGAALLGIAGLAALLFAEEPARHKAEKASWQSFSRVATRPLLLMVSLMGILLQFAVFSGVFGFIPVYATSIGASSTDLGIITMLVLASSAVAALVAVYLAERRGYLFTIVLGATLISISLLAIPFIGNVFLLEAVQVSYGLGRGVLSTTLMTLSLRAVPPQQQATAMGVYQAVYAVGMLTGPLVSGFLADSYGLNSVFYLSASLCLVIAALAWLPILPRR